MSRNKNSSEETPNIVMTTSFSPFDVQITSDGETSTIAAQYDPSKGWYDFKGVLSSDAEWVVLPQEETGR